MKKVSKTRRQHIDLWLPPASTRIRAILLIANNTDSYLINEHPAVRDVAAKHHMAIMHLKNVSGGDD